MLTRISRALKAVLVALFFAVIGAGVGMVLTPESTVADSCTWTECDLADLDCDLSPEPVDCIWNDDKSECEEVACSPQ